MIKTGQMKFGPAGDSTTAILALVESLEEELADTKQKFGSLVLDFEELRKRAAQEVKRDAAAQKARLVSELLPIVNNLQRISIQAPEVYDPLGLLVRKLSQQLRVVLDDHARGC
jgi:molecular chaperone GrpE (heat shock protein)